MGIDYRKYDSMELPELEIELAKLSRADKIDVLSNILCQEFYLDDHVTYIKDILLVLLQLEGKAVVVEDREIKVAGIEIGLSGGNYINLYEEEPYVYGCSMKVDQWLQVKPAIDKLISEVASGKENNDG